MKFNQLNLNVGIFFLQISHLSLCSLYSQYVESAFYFANENRSFIRFPVFLRTSVKGHRAAVHSRQQTSACGAESSLDVLNRQEPANQQRLSVFISHSLVSPTAPPSGLHYDAVVWGKLSSLHSAAK